MKVTSVSADRITDRCNYGLNLSKMKPASLLKSNLQLIQSGVSHFWSRWIELNKCVDTVIVRRGQLKDASNERKTSSWMELIEQIDN